jgi:glutamate-1-semialdehyde 2,1-aminomutase
VLDPHRENPLYHGGSFNGNLLSCVAGRVSLEHLTRETIAAMDARTGALREALLAEADALGLPLIVVGEGSVLGVYVTEHLTRHDGSFNAGEPTRLLHLAALNHGVLMGPGGEIALSSATAGEALERARDGLLQALADVARLSIRATE